VKNKNDYGPGELVKQIKHKPFFFGRNKPAYIFAAKGIILMINPKE
jgi:hypothetical protein